MTRLRRAALAVALASSTTATAACRPPDGATAGDEAGVSDAGPMPDVNTDSMAGQGYLAVEARACGQCHQSPDPNDGVLSGQTTAVPGTQAYGSNLTPDPDTGMDAWDAGDIARAVLHGVDNESEPLCPAMPSYADGGMGNAEALAIAAYLQTLTPVWHAVPASLCPPLKPAGDGG
jgi:mono/diheme cytochrome c family protein